MNLNKLQRHTVYIILQAEVEQYSFDRRLPFICPIADNLFDTNFTFYPEDLKDSLPEMYKRRPRKPRHDCGGGWYHMRDYKSRIRMLEKCINETAK